jgi:hypothetical protein
VHLEVYTVPTLHC